jgi:hypothetical protein
MPAERERLWQVAMSVFPVFDRYPARAGVALDLAPFPIVEQHLESPCHDGSLLDSS